MHRSEDAAGAYAPLLTKAGLLVADGAIVSPHAHIFANSDPHPQHNLGEYLR